MDLFYYRLALGPRGFYRICVHGACRMRAGNSGSRLVLRSFTPLWGNAVGAVQRRRSVPVWLDSSAGVYALGRPGGRPKTELSYAKSD